MDNNLIITEDGQVIKGIKDKSVKHIIIPNGVRCIGENAFEGCSSLINVDISNNVTTISDNAFRNCCSLESVVIPESVNIIGKSAFARCSKLSRVTIPSQINSIGIKAFHDTPFYDSMEDGVIYLGRCLYKCKGKQSLNREIVVKDGTESILPNAFKYHEEIESVIIPNSVTSIGDMAFWGCRSLEYISIPNNVANIGKDVFVGTKWYNNKSDNAIYINNILYKKFENSLEKSFTIRKGTVRISCSAFEGCTSLHKITIPYGVISIGDRAFYGCTSLHDLDIPNSVVSIGKSSFQNCKSLENVDIPNSVESIGEGAFQDCSSLQSIDIPNSVKTIGKCAFMWCYSLQSINIPCSLHIIENGTFQQCSSIKSICIPSSVTSIGDVAFYGCEALQCVELPNSIVSIGVGAFSNCLSLQNVIIPNSVIVIGNQAFNGTLLKKVIIPSSVESIDEDAFGNEPNLSDFFVDKDNRHFLSIEGVLYKYNLEENETYKLLKYPPMKEVSKFTLNPNVTHLESYAFKWAVNLEEIVLHDNLLDLGNTQSFFLCKSLKDIKIPPKISNIPNSCFEGCESLEHIYISNKERIQIENNSFKGCVSLKGFHLLIEDPVNIITINDSFDETIFNNCILFIPSGTRWAYRHHPILGKFKNIEIENRSITT